MIETSVRHRENLNFIYDIKIVEPREKRNGVYVELVKYKYMTSEMTTILKAIGMRYSGEDELTDSSVYTFYPWGYYQYILMRKILKAYWWFIKVLYYNARFFQPVEVGEKFSWKYFTPVSWFLVRKKR